MATTLIDEQAWTDSDTARAKQVWAEYQESHDVSAQVGKAVGIDPASGKVWFGDSIIDIHRQKEQAGVNSRLLVLRVGRDYYWRKGGRRHDG